MLGDTLGLPSAMLKESRVDENEPRLAIARQVTLSLSSLTGLHTEVLNHTSSKTLMWYCLGFLWHLSKRPRDDDIS